MRLNFLFFKDSSFDLMVGITTIERSLLSVLDYYQLLLKTNADDYNIEVPLEQEKVTSGIENHVTYIEYFTSDTELLLKHSSSSSEDEVCDEETKPALDLKIH